MTNEGDSEVCEEEEDSCGELDCRPAQQATCSLRGALPCPATSPAHCAGVFQLPFSHPLHSYSTFASVA